MNDFDTNTFLTGIHRKIRRKKRIRSAGLTIFLILLAGTISIQSTKTIYETKMEQLWSSIPSTETEYEWEDINEVSETESLEYLIDELEMDELVEFIVEEYDEQWLDSIKLEG